MKINIKNLLFQPLALHLAKDGEGLHLSARECRDILAEHVSEEIQRAAARGLVALIDKIGDGLDQAGGGSSGEDTLSREETAREPQAKQKKGRAK